MIKKADLVIGVKAQFQESTYKIMGMNAELVIFPTRDTSGSYSVLNKNDVVTVIGNPIRDGSYNLVPVSTNNCNGYMYLSAFKVAIKI